MKFLRPEHKSSPSPLSREEALQCIPSIHSSIKVVELDSGDIMLEYPLRMKPFFLSLFRRFRKSEELPTKKLQLDEMGSQVWKAIDNNTNVQTIINNFAKQYQITLHEAEKSVTTFLVELGKRGLIALR